MWYGVWADVMRLAAILASSPLASSSLTSLFYHSHYFFPLLFFPLLFSSFLFFSPHLSIYGLYLFLLVFLYFYNKKKIQANSTNLSLLVTSFLTYLLYPRILPPPHLSIYSLYLFLFVLCTLYNKKRYKLTHDKLT